MSYMNLLDHIAGAATFANDDDACSPCRICLRGVEDQVTLRGPLDLNVSVVASSFAKAVTGEKTQAVEAVLYDYDVSISSGHDWTYRYVDSLIPIDSQRAVDYCVIIRPVPPTKKTPLDPCDDLPCDFGVRKIPDSSCFFPASCEPCPPGALIATPPVCRPTLAVPTARGGCVRPRYFNGMFITREDLETELRYLRLKNRLHNRALGQGVVWGLSVARRGNQIVVEPGYAVDCCGNDIVITCDYGVDVGTLLRDPAACPELRPEPTRMHLLLESIDCEQDPRPVHGDPCGNRSGSEFCEMSRVRETARLRLVPPRDYRPDTPIGRFLEGVRELLGRQSDPQGAAGSTGSTTAAGSVVPFSVHIEQFNATDPGFSDPFPLDLEPGVSVDARGDKRMEQLHANPIWGFTRVTLTADPGFSFVNPGSVGFQQTRHDAGGTSFPPVPPFEAGTNHTPLVVGSDTATFEVHFPRVLTAPPASTATTGIEPQLSFRVQGWTLFDGTSTHEGSSDVEVALLSRGAWQETEWGQAHADLLTEPPLEEAELILHANVPAAAVTVRTPTAGTGWPCGCEPCTTTGEALFPTLPPFLHPCPTATSKWMPGDPKAWLVAALYAWLASEVERGRRATPPQTTNPRIEVARVLFEVSWRLFGVTTMTDTLRRQLTDLVARLFHEWCEGFLYKGPTCDDEHHGVVIGCATVASGDICCVDPWGGRRWVVHHPLRAHWGEQIGLAAFDVTVSRVASLLCCFAGLRVPHGPAPGITGDLNHAGSSFVGSIDDGVVAAGDAWAVFGDRARLETVLAASGLTIAREESVGVDEAIRLAAASFTRPAVSTDTPRVLYTVEGVGDLHFVAPDLLAAAGPGVVERGERAGRVWELAHDSIGAVEGFPALLREPAEELTVELARATPLVNVLASEDDPIREPLEARGLSTAASVLESMRPDVLVADVVGAGRSAELGQALTRSEALTRDIAKSVTATFASLHKNRGLRFRGDLSGEELRDLLARSIAKQLKMTVVSVDAAVGKVVNT